VCISSGNVHTCPPVNVVKWTAVDYIHHSYNTLINSTSTRIDNSELCKRRFQHSRDTTSRHWVELTVTSCFVFEDFYISYSGSTISKHWNFSNHNSDFQHFTSTLTAVKLSLHHWRQFPPELGLVHVNRFPHSLPVLPSHPYLTGVRGEFFDFTDACRWVLAHFGCKNNTMIHLVFCLLTL